MDGAHEDQVTAVPNTVQSVGESSSTTESGLNKTNERTTEVPREEESTTSPTTASATSAPEPVGRNRTRINRIDVHHHFIPTCYANGKSILPPSACKPLNELNPSVAHL